MARSHYFRSRLFGASHCLRINTDLSAIDMYGHLLACSEGDSWLDRSSSPPRYECAETVLSSSTGDQDLGLRTEDNFLHFDRYLLADLGALLRLVKAE